MELLAVKDGVYYVPDILLRMFLQRLMNPQKEFFPEERLMNPQKEFFPEE